MTIQVKLCVLCGVKGAQDTNSIHSGLHGVPLPEAVWCHFPQRSVPTHERGLHQAGRDDQHHEEPPRRSGAR